MPPEPSWYIVRQAEGYCDIQSHALTQDEQDAGLHQWGPFPSQEDAIRRRRGLIQVGQCRPR